MTSAGITIRRLGPGDAAAARAMNALFAEAFEDQGIYLGAPPGHDYLAGLLGRQEVVALVAVADARTVGALVGYVLPKFEQARAEFYVYDLAVDAGFRRRGIGRALMQHARETARAAGAWVMFVQADPQDAPAVALYEGMGVREDVLHFDVGV